MLGGGGGWSFLEIKIVVVKIGEINKWPKIFYPQKRLK